jgi:hypothetical protein
MWCCVGRLGFGTSVRYRLRGDGFEINYAKRGKTGRRRACSMSRAVEEEEGTPFQEDLDVAFQLGKWSSPDIAAIVRLRRRTKKVSLIFSK